MSAPLVTIAKHFDAQYRIDEKTGCWVWLRARKGKEAKTGGGYGCFKLNGKTVGAHRFSYERSHGPLPEGAHAAHKCHNTLCVNPEHLEAQTNEQNQAEKAATGKAPHILSPEQVRAIRDRVTAGELQRVVAADFNIHQADVSNIVNKVYWKHLG